MIDPVKSDQAGTETDADDFRALLRRRGFVESEQARLTPLTGGVSSEIYLVEDGDRRFVVKRALEKLKVKDDWFADTSRNHSEQAYMRYVAGFRPDAMPEIYQSDAEAGLFAMEYLDGFRNWKQELLAGECDIKLASQAGVLLGEIHARSWSDPQAKTDFDSIPNFDQLRIDPYLRATAAKHSDLAAKILAEAERLTNSRQCLIHGDFSPKNIMVKGNRLVPLDCEVACYADAAFDLAFFLNHLFLKSLFHSRSDLPFDAMVTAARTGYRKANAAHADEVEMRTANLLPMLLLARVDGKSPVEYLNQAKQSIVRSFVKEQSSDDNACLEQIEKNWFSNLQHLMNE
jgi:aminoglycoside phosphotransferase (APT) family kinase protein